MNNKKNIETEVAMVTMDGVRKRKPKEEIQIIDHSIH